MTALSLPRVLPSGNAVRALVAEAGLPPHISGALVVDGRALVYGNVSAARELLHQALEVHGADHLELIGVPLQFQQLLRVTAASGQVEHLLHFVGDLPGG